MIDWQEIDTVLLDMDGTLLDLHFDDYFWLAHLPKRYAEYHSVNEETATQHIHEHIARLEGTLEWYCLDHWSELVNMDIPALKHEVKHKIQIRPYTEDFLRCLKDMGKQLVLITNAHRRGLDLKMELTRIDRWLDVVVSSHDFGSPKEDQLFWQQLIKFHPFEPTRTMFIDDTPRVLRSAQHFGIEHLVCITTPNSQKPEKSSEEFFGVSHFNELLPMVQQQ